MTSLVITQGPQHLEVCHNVFADADGGSIWIQLGLRTVCHYVVRCAYRIFHMMYSTLHVFFLEAYLMVYVGNVWLCNSGATLWHGWTTR